MPSKTISLNAAPNLAKIYCKPVAVDHLKYDVTIAGAGVAGMTSALLLAQNGLRVAVIEKQAINNAKIGECLQASAIDILTKIGLASTFITDNHLSLQGYRVAWDKYTTYERSLLASTSGTGWIVNRKRFDNMLIKAAKKAGVHFFWQSSINNLTELKTQQTNNTKTWTLQLYSSQGSLEIQTRFLLDASGRSRAIARQLGSKKRKADSLVASFCRLDHQACKTPPTQQALIESSENGWWFTVAYSERHASLCYFTDADLGTAKSAKQLLELAQYQPELKNWLKDYTLATCNDFTLTAAYSSCLDKCVGDNWLAVGDAACSYDPLSSYGITSALGGAFYAAKALLNAFYGKPEYLQTYQQLMQQKFLDFLSMRNAEYNKVTQFDSAFWQRRAI